MACVGPLVFLCVVPFWIFIKFGVLRLLHILTNFTDVLLIYKAASRDCMSHLNLTYFVFHEFENRFKSCMSEIKVTTYWLGHQMTVWSRVRLSQQLEHLFSPEPDQFSPKLLPFYFLIHFKFILQSTSSSSKWSPSFRFPKPKPCIYLSPYLLHIPSIHFFI